jgi:glycosyltransferase involved in cell wall biosynthesis
MTTVPISLLYLITGQVKNARQHGFDVFMASADGKEREEVMKIEQTNHHILPFERDISLLQDLKSLFLTVQYIRKINPDIVHTHTPKAGLIGMLAAFICRVPIRIHTVAGMPLEGLTGLKKNVVFITEKLTYKLATNVWPNSNSLLNFIKEQRLTSEGKLDIIGQGTSNGIDLTEFNSKSIKTEILDTIKEKIQHDDNNIYLVSVGRIVSQKGINELVTVFEKIVKKKSNLRLILVGPFEDERDPISSKTRKAIEEMNEIISVGYSNKVKYYLHLADLLVFPSHREGFPNVPMQSGAMECPVIASKIKGNVDLITHKQTGLLHEVKNETDLEEKILFALENEIEVKKMTANLAKCIKEKFDRRYVQKEIINQYQKLLGNK